MGFICNCFLFSSVCCIYYRDISLYMLSYACESKFLSRYKLSSCLVLTSGINPKQDLSNKLYKFLPQDLFIF